MKVKMLKSTQGSDNGYQVNQYVEGKSYEVSDSLGRFFVDSKLATEGGDKDVTSFHEASADDSQLGLAARGQVLSDVEGQNEADKKAGIVRPEMDRLLEVSRRNEGTDRPATTSVIEPSGRAKRKVIRTDATDKASKDSNQNTTAGKALKSSDYSNKAANPKDQKGK